MVSPLQGPLEQPCMSGQSHAVREVETARS